MPLRPPPRDPQWSRVSTPPALTAGAISLFRYQDDPIPPARTGIPLAWFPPETQLNYRPAHPAYRVPR